MLRVATWNVLHPAYAVPERYRGVAPVVLDPRLRSAAVRDRVEQLLSTHDVVALQEVDAATAAELVGARTALLVATRPHAPDGVLLAAHRHPLLRARTGASSDGRRVWCAAEVEGVTVVCTHLDWSDATAPATHRGLDQLVELLDWLDAGSSTGSGDGPGGVVLLGDINASSEGRVGAALAAAGFTHLAAGASTAAVAGVTVSLDTVAVRGIDGSARALGSLPAPGSPYLLPDDSVPSDHVPVVATLT